MAVISSKRELYQHASPPNAMTAKGKEEPFA